MTIFKKICYSVLTVALAAVITLSCITSNQQSTSGGYSAATTITERSAAWILDQFGHYETVPDLLTAIDQFGCAEFVYELYLIPVVQYFDLDKFIFEKDFHGICFDFSCFVKCVVLVWKEAHQREDVRAYVYDVFPKKLPAHSYNFIFEDGHTWFLCLTTNNTHVSKGKKSLGITDIFPQDPVDYAASYQEKVYNIH